MKTHFILKTLIIIYKARGCQLSCLHCLYTKLNKKLDNLFLLEVFFR